MSLQFDELSPEVLARGIGQLYFSGIDDADIYLQRGKTEHWSLSEHKVKQASYNGYAGLGVRAIVGSQTGFAYSDTLQAEELFAACRFARGISKSGRDVAKTEIKPRARSCRPMYPVLDTVMAMSYAQKTALLHLVDEYAYSLDKRVCDVSVSLGFSYSEIFLMRLDGDFYADIRPMISFRVAVVVEENGRRESGSAGAGGRGVFDDFFDLEKIKAYTKSAVDTAILNLNAQPAPAGKMPVVLGNGWTGILLHEAVGHGLEADFNRKGTSVFTGKIGEKVCSSLCTVIDDGSIYARRGSLSIDDEGTATKPNVLIENGVLCSYMQDRMNARLMQAELTGNGRRESYSHLPMPRMTNTYLQPGTSSREEIIKSVKKGIYAEEFGGGQVDITNGQFVFAATRCSLIEDGKITQPLKGATLIGNGLEVMQKISMVADDLELDPGIGTCGKNGQSVPVGVGMPSVKIDELTVGGTEL
ncbi:MAG: metalloprotease TldD [Cardiobacteriaceae bacterium]|nr:metalloprotease TldD [Cardiobacteriaceae bacterium]